MVQSHCFHLKTDMIARLFLSHEFIEFIKLPQGGKPAIGDGVLWTCKRRRSLKRSLEIAAAGAVSLGGSVVASHHR